MWRGIGRTVSAARHSGLRTSANVAEAAGSSGDDKAAAASPVSSASESFDVSPLRHFRRPRRPSWRRLMMDREREVDTSVVSDRYRQLEDELFDHNKTPSSSAASMELRTAEFAARF